MLLKALVIMLLRTLTMTGMTTTLGNSGDTSMQDTDLQLVTIG